MGVSTSIREGLYVGLISGTSMDGVDAVLVDLRANGLDTLASLTIDYPSPLRRRLLNAIAPGAAITLDELATLDIEIGRVFASAAERVLDTAACSAAEIIAIGSHGQTLCHGAHQAVPYTLQVGDAATIAATVGATTVADFRSLDVAYGGEGAPLVPPFHAWALGSVTHNRVIANIGGLTNLSLLTAGSSVPVGGFDCGPGNCLMDEWSAHVRGEPMDRGGAWAARGRVINILLRDLLTEPFYARPAPKSTGRELFNLAYLQRFLSVHQAHAAADVQATLAELTVETLAREVERLPPGSASQVFVCGGGACNEYLMTRLKHRLAPLEVCSTTALGLDPSMVEATAFAWLAAMRIAELPVTTTTGGRVAALRLGAVYLPSS
jgi:anhydro-N-acetylmuramic acid kinase